MFLNEIILKGSKKNAIKFRIYISNETCYNANLIDLLYWHG